MQRMFLFVFLYMSALAGAADDVILSTGERVQGDLAGGRGAWKLGGKTLRGSDVLIVRFSPDLPPVRVSSGIFVRGGSLLSGSLVSLIGDTAEISGTPLGALKLKRDDVAGVFSPLPAGQPENMPELARYATLTAITLGATDAPLRPGENCRVRFAGLDEIQAERVMRIGTEQLLLSAKNKGVESINRQFVRLIELRVPALAPAPTDAQLGPEVVVRLKAGDLLRGRVLKLDDKALVLQTTFLTDCTLDRSLLATLFLAGADGGVTWLSSQKPARSVHTPYFDANFPARMDASVDGNNIVLHEQSCVRGIGVHSRSELEFALPGSPARLIALAGIDAETKGRGGVTARILADGKEVWKSPALSGKDAPLPIVSDLGPAKSLVLQVDFGPDNDDSGDHFDWGWAAVVNR